MTNTITHFSFAQKHPFSTKPDGGKRKHYPLKALALTLAASTALLTSGPAMALDGVDFFKALQAEAERNGNVITFESLEPSGDDGARASGILIVNNQKGDRLSIGEMILSGAEVVADDGFAFEAMQASNITLTPKDENGSNSKLSLGSVTAEGFRVLPAENRKNPFWPMNIDEGKIERITLVSGGKNPVSLNIPSFSISGLEHGQDGISFTLDEAVLAAGNGSFASNNGSSGEFATGELVMSDAARIGQAGFSVDVFSFDGISATGSNEKGEDIAFSFGGLSGSDLFSPDYTADADKLFPEEEMNVTIGSARFMLDGQELFSMAGGASVAQYDSDNGLYEFEGALNDIYLDVKSLPASPQNAKGKQNFLDLGYDDITLDVSLSGDWDIAAGLLNLQSYKFAADRMASFDLSLKLDGYSVEAARKLQQISNRMNDADDPAIKQAMSMQLLAELSALSVSELQLKLEDDSLTRRIMQQQAKKSGQSADDMAAALPFMAGAMLAQLDVPEFAASVSAAIGAYFTSALNDQGKLTLKAKPEEPVSFAEIMGIAAGARAGNVKPAEIIERLNLTISGE